ncbi:MAG TPA: LLM class flavin-dependent oxidoreductase [Gaiellaceae bacterium]|nr:LLM class flavin-dependent oxidoreductase [Gaiellaceae bacterium]
MLPPLSILDLAPIVEGGTAAGALGNSAELARHAERWGYERFWLAEHHNAAGIASAATAVVIAHVAAATSTIRVGAGGVMLPNHAPLVIAEQFGTLAELHPGRIDLGLGRAPGTDRLTMLALRRDHPGSDTFPQDVLELQALLAEPRPGQAVRAIPGAGTRVPLWILGSSLYGAQLAAALGLPYAFASHFAPDALLPALEIYRERFEPSEQLERPHAMVAASAFVADDDAGARRPLHLRAAVVRERPARAARSAAAADRRHRGLLDRGGEGARLADAEPLVRRLAGDGAPGARALRRGDGRRRADPRVRDPRPRRAAPLVRAARLGVIVFAREWKDREGR